MAAICVKWCGQLSRNRSRQDHHANFQQTASTVEISPLLEHLLYEISHLYRNWQLIIGHYLSHEQGPDCFALISSLTPQTLPRYGDVEV